LSRDFATQCSVENALGRFEQARTDAERAMWLSPRDFLNTTFLMIAGDADINLDHFDAAIDAYRRALDSGFRQFFVYARLSAAYADAGRIDEAKASLAEARRLNPKFTVKSMIEHMPNWPAVFEASERPGCRRSDRRARERGRLRTAFPLAENQTERCTHCPPIDKTARTMASTRLPWTRTTAP
jgi:tetratricopeptide (TPR) repeat protein